jgi:outer membrane protein insertion porin family
MYFRIIILLFLLSASQIFAQPVVSSITFFGNNFFTNNELMNAMVTKKDKPFNKDQFNLDLKSIREKYREAGYLLAKIIKSEIVYDSDSLIVDLNITVDEEKSVNIGMITVSGNNVISSKSIFNIFETKVGKPLDDNTLNNDIRELLDAYEKKGIPFAKAYVEDVSLYYDGKTPRLSVSVVISEDSKVKIDRVRIKGNEITDEDVIIRELKLSKDKFVSRDAMQNMKSRLEKLNIFESVEDPKIYTINRRKPDC